MSFVHQSGDIIGDRYKIIGILGKGGIGITYAAIDLHTQEKVALKAVSLQQLQDWKQVELLEREASVLAQLNHPTIPKYLDYFQVDSEDERIFYIVQQLAPGKSLHQLIKSGWRSNETEIKKIATQILDIFSYLHSLDPPIIHRDIKPHNLILSDDGKIFLVDFGAVQNTYYNTLMKGSTVVGTYGYMAPEQFKGKATPGTDLYGLGATILYLLTHRSPNELPQDTLTINFRSSVNISEGFTLWLEKILQPDLAERFGSAREALDKLNDRYLFTNALKNKWKIALNLGLVGAIAIGGIFGFINYKWAILSRLNFSPSSSCDSSKFIKDYLNTGGDLDINWYDSPVMRADDQMNFFTCVENIDYASLEEKQELAKLLIAKGADVDARDAQGRTPLMSVDRPAIARLLIAKGADVNARDDEGRTPLMNVYNPDIFIFLETNINKPPEEKQELAKLLIAKGADVNARDVQGRTPLMEVEDPGVAKLLINEGANVNARDNYGDTPLSSINNKLKSRNYDNYYVKSAQAIKDILIQYGAEE
jgi:serine/threonine protein kinase